MFNLSNGLSLTKPHIDCSAPYTLGAAAAFAALVCITPLQAQEGLTSQQTVQGPTTPLNTNPTASDLQTTTGGWSPRIKLALPPATRDLKPDISLVYHSSRHNGFIGAGWGLAFESSIEARSATGGAPIMGGGGSATNIYYLNGHKLVRMGDGTYRTQQDSHTIYRKIESGGVVVGWTGKRNGTTMAWGQVHPFDADNNAITYQDERVVWTSSGVGVPTTARGDHPIRWSISSITDRLDNDIRFRYRIPIIVAPSLGGAWPWWLSFMQHQEGSRKSPHGKKRPSTPRAAFSHSCSVARGVEHSLITQRRPESGSGV